jgi:hypothetical protein
MSVPEARHSFTVGEYHRMTQAGIFTEDDRVELIEGEVVHMAAIGSRHAACVDRLNRLFVRQAGDRAIVRVQNPVRLGDLSEPEPDLVLARARADFYAAAHPTAADVLLLVEVSDSSHRYDETVKVPLYARYGIPEVWIVDLETDAIQVHRLPAGEAFGSVVSAHPQQTLSPAALPDVRIPVRDALGT